MESRSEKNCPATTCDWCAPISSQRLPCHLAATQALVLKSAAINKCAGSPWGQDEGESKEPRSKLRGISEDTLKLITKAEASFGEFNPRD
jgi:hypothetical protein